MNPATVDAVVSKSAATITAVMKPIAEARKETQFARQNHIWLFRLDSQPELPHMIFTSKRVQVRQLSPDKDRR